MKKTLLSLVFAFFSLGAAFAWYGEDAQKNYDVAERLFDEKRYKEAIEEYLKVVEETESLYELKDSDKRDIASEPLLKFDGIGEAKILYYSLYNIACCHSLIENFAESKKYLIAALHAGYPSLNYILNDSDMRPFFSSARSLKSEITEIYNLGNSKSLVQGKKFKRWVVNDCDAYGFNGDTVIQYYDTSDWLDHKIKRSLFLVKTWIYQIELPENLKKLADVLFWYNEDDDKKWTVYVSGYSETPPNWQQKWDMYCNIHFGEYMEETQ